MEHGDGSKDGQRDDSTWNGTRLEFGAMLLAYVTAMTANPRVARPGLVTLHFASSGRHYSGISFGCNFCLMHI